MAGRVLFHPRLREVVIGLEMKGSDLRNRLVHFKVSDVYLPNREKVLEDVDVDWASTLAAFGANSYHRPAILGNRQSRSS